MFNQKLALSSLSECRAIIRLVSKEFNKWELKVVQKNELLTSALSTHSNIDGNGIPFFNVKNDLVCMNLLPKTTI